MYNTKQIAVRYIIEYSTAEDRAKCPSQPSCDVIDVDMEDEEEEEIQTIDPVIGKCFRSSRIIELSGHDIEYLTIVELSVHSY